MHPAEHTRDFYNCFARVVLLNELWFGRRNSHPLGKQAARVGLCVTDAVIGFVLPLCYLNSQERYIAVDSVLLCPCYKRHALRVRLKGEA